MDKYQQTHEVPKEVYQVVGCDCGGLWSHLTTCSLLRNPQNVFESAINEAISRLDTYTHNYWNS